MLVAFTLLVVMQGPTAHSLVPTCLNSPLDLIPDPEDCHIFYQCDLNPQPMSCGNMMFNSLRQVCDWPSTVLQLRPECRQEEQFRFSGQAYPYHRTLRMLKWLGNGDQFSQKRLRAPQDVGLGRRRISGNKEYFTEDVGNSLEVVSFDNHADNEAMSINEKEKQKIVEDQTSAINNKNSINLSLDIKNQVLEEIRRRLPQIVKNSLPKLDYNNQVIVTNHNNQQQAVSTPADTIRLTPQKISISSAPQTTRPKPTPYNQLQQDSSFVAQTQGPSFAYQQVYPGQASPAHITYPAPTSALAPAHTPVLTPVLAPAPAPTPLNVQLVPNVQATPAEGPIAISTTPEITPADTVRLATNIPLQQNNRQLTLPNPNQPQLAPILVEDTREFKPVWTVTRERPRQILLKYRNGNIQNQQQTSCADKKCPRLRQRVLRKIKRKWVAGEKHQLDERRKELIQGTKAAQKSVDTLQEDIEESEREAITLKEAYDRAINKVEQSQKNRPAPGNLLHEILNRDFGSKSNISYGEYNSQNYVNSGVVSGLDE